MRGQLRRSFPVRTGASRSCVRLRTSRPISPRSRPTGRTSTDGTGAVQLFEFDELPCDFPNEVCLFFRARNPSWSPDGTKIAYDVVRTSCGGHECVPFSDGI